MESELFQQLDPPNQPGVYLMKDPGDKIIYVGKAISLRKRLQTYFRNESSLDPKTRVLIGKVAKIDLLVTDSEVDALVLECNLIKKYHPRYNILMRDDKSYPYLKLTLNETFPQLCVSRKPFIDEARYFGPFVNGDVKKVAQQLAFFYRLCPCKPGTINSHAQRGCLYYQMGQCPGACLGKVTPEKYAVQVAQVIDFLEGRADPVTPRLLAEMQKAADQQQFEYAATLRDQIQQFKKAQYTPLVNSLAREDQDIIGLARSGANATIEIFQMRLGKLESRRHYYLSHAGMSTGPEIISQILSQYYSQPVSLPPRILLPELPEEEALLKKWLANRRPGELVFSLPATAEETRLIKLAETNAWLYLKRRLQENARELTNENRELLSEVAKQLHLSGPPYRVEAYDISNFSGQDAVGSQVVFSNGEPDKAAYRRYRIRSVKGSDDYAMLQEVLIRRLRKLKTESTSVPDLIVIDGGLGQLSAVHEVLQQLQLEHLAILALAKQAETIYQPGRQEPLSLPKASAPLAFLIRLRDEAHRFALSYHKQLRGQRFTLSLLDQIKGLGPNRRRLLLRSFGSVAALLQVPEAEIAALPGIGSKLAREIKRVLRKYL